MIRVADERVCLESCHRFKSLRKIKNVKKLYVENQVVVRDTSVTPVSDYELSKISSSSQMNQPPPHQAYTPPSTKQFNGVLDSSNPLGFFESALEFAAQESMLFRPDSTVNHVNLVLKRIKEKNKKS